MSALLAAVIAADQPAPLAQWHSFWDRLRGDRLQRGEAAAILAAMSARMPDPSTVEAMVSSLVDGPGRRVLDHTVNIVGTGGGCRTFNISTAAAIVAAAQGVRVLKTGSQAYSSKLGSFDLLRRLGVPLTTSYEETVDALDRDGIAFAGHFVYPAELAALAKAVAPLDFRVLGRVVNTIGPFLAQVTAKAQLTGVSRPAHLPVLRRLAQRERELGRQVWLASNDLGADELIGFTVNEVDRGVEQEPIWLDTQSLGLNWGSLIELAPAEPSRAAEHFLGILGGEAVPTALQAVSLNAAALAMLAGQAKSWTDAIGAAAETMMSGRAVRLVERLATGRRVASYV